MTHTQVDDRGPSKYFHGRCEIRNLFSDRLDHYKSVNGGTTFLIKGPPGAGKSALLDVIAQDAVHKGWNVRMKVTPEDFHNPARMAQTLSVQHSPTESTKTTVNLEFFKHEWKSEKTREYSVAQIIAEAASFAPLLLVLDEAQHLINLASPHTVKDAATSTLNAIHNGHIGYPVMLLAAGLGTSEHALNTLGVSRFAGPARIRLGPIDHESTCAVIHDYITGEGGTNLPKEWIEPIAERTHGWPQHIVCYARAAALHLASLPHPPTESDLNVVMRRGRRDQEEYYHGRAHDISWGQREILAYIFAKIPEGGSVRRRTIVSALSEEYPHEVAEATFKRALHQGILDQKKNGAYGVPIPSMRQWLVDEYGPDKTVKSDTPILLNQDRPPHKGEGNGHFKQEM